MLVIFILINLSMIACGGVVFTLGLTGYWANNPNFAYLMVIKLRDNFLGQTKKCHSAKVGSSCFMCWGTLSTTFDILALLGIYQKKRKLLLPWLVWYMLEVVAVVGLVMMSTVYSDSDTLYLLPVLVKPLVTIFAWFNVRYVYKSSLRKFYSRNLSYY